MAQEIMKELEGKAVKNHTSAIGKAVGFEVKHKGNFIFEGRRGDEIVFVYTTPTDEEQEKVFINQVVADKPIKLTAKPQNKKTVYKAGITYHMIRGSEVVKAYIDLPVSQERYAQLLEGKANGDGVDMEFRQVILSLALLQGYNGLGGISLDLTVEA